ncbi:hypothetical protein [Allomuricauda sp. SCSIO 65647]|uniref:hypothetical protein n=1 Tax=Allomuricauda sp. SCSIO 65647 TaxID=2908843 RepID=UPI001F3DCCF4|nr:hypothetical protein [Muricauda sp. SCSIO 65647]UJH68815.1 hypothetical protein L0P89_06250 [Muricauda sp. SCSIO 65647]
MSLVRVQLGERSETEAIHESGWLFSLGKLGEKFTLSLTKGFQLGERSETEAIHESGWLFSWKKRAEKFTLSCHPERSRRGSRSGRRREF